MLPCSRFVAASPSSCRILLTATLSREEGCCPGPPRTQAPPPPDSPSSPFPSPHTRTACPQARFVSSPSPSSAATENAVLQQERSPKSGGLSPGRAKNWPRPAPARGGHQGDGRYVCVCVSVPAALPFPSRWGGVVGRRKRALHRFGRFYKTQAASF